MRGDPTHADVASGQESVSRVLRPPHPPPHTRRVLSAGQRYGTAGPVTTLRRLLMGICRPGLSLRDEIFFFFVKDSP